MGEIIQLGLNRVEGDLEIRIDFEDRRIQDAWCVGTMFRGFEQMLRGRAATDGAVLTPRVCGICGTAHHYTAISAVESAIGCEIAPHGIRSRNLCLMAEEVQSDARHTFLMFTVDFCNERYADHPLAEQVQAAFTPLTGTAYAGTLQHSKNLLKIVSLIGGQWPHASYMVPGGVTQRLRTDDLIRIRTLLDSYQRWYERDVLGCTLDRWRDNRSWSDVEAWLEEAPAHRDSPLGLFIRFGRAVGLQDLGRGCGNLLSYGSGYEPEAWKPPFDELACIRKAGFQPAGATEPEPFDHRLVQEYIDHSWYLGYEGGRHPWDGETIPAYDPDGDKYTWAKAPRYKDLVVECGPFAELVVDGDPLFCALNAEEGSNAFSRQLARLHRPTSTLRSMRRMVDELLAQPAEPYLVPCGPIEEGEGVGFSSAARGALAHWVRFANGKITQYQIITPTAWNASPRAADGQRGHWEESLVGTEIRDLDNPIEMGHIIRSHDACLVCTVHFLDSGQRVRFGT